MKGTLFFKPAQYELEIQGEQWRQGDLLKGILAVTNHGQQELELGQIGVCLVRGEHKKLKNDTTEGLTQLMPPTNFAQAKLAPGKANQLEWSFQLERNCLISDKKESLFMRFGKLDEGTSSKFLQLTVIPRSTIDQYLEIFGNFFRFKLKEKKNAKGGRIEAVLIPPQSRDFSTIDSLSCFLVESDKDFSIDYQFKIKSLEYGGGGVQDVKMEKKKKECQQVFQKRDYLLYGDSANMDFFIKKIGEALESAKPKLL